MEKFHNIWPTWTALAADLGAPYPTVNSWGRRGIPHRRFRQIIDAAKTRGFEISHAWLEGVNANISTGSSQNSEDEERDAA